MRAATVVEGGADVEDLELARDALCAAAEGLAAVCRDRGTSPGDIADATDRVLAAFGAFGGLMLLEIAASRR